MKRLLTLLTIITFFYGCENQEFDYPDFDYTAVYFPLQYPVRTLVLGEDRIDNSDDNELKFQIGVAIGGLYKNDQKWTVDFTLDPSLMDNMINQNADTLRMLPQRFISSLNPSNQIEILPGKFSGFTEVQLTEEFLNDTLASFANYVIPLRITGSTADSILTGKATVDNPNVHITDNWDLTAPPKDFVLFGIKYINNYHGFYLHRGIDYVRNESGQIIDTVIFRNKYIIDDQVVKLTTAGKNIVLTNFAGISLSNNNKYKMKLSFDENGNIQIEQAEPTGSVITGSGKFVKEGDSWGGVKHKTMYLNYTFTAGSDTHEVTDTLVFRNNGIAFEENVVTLVQ